MKAIFMTIDCELGVFYILGSLYLNLLFFYNKNIIGKYIIIFIQSFTN